MAEIAGLLVSGGFLLAASTFMGNPNDANKDEAKDFFNSYLEKVKSSNQNPLLGFNNNGEVFKPLSELLNKFEISSEFDTTRNILKADFSSKLAYPNFANEKKLFTELLELGLLVYPGEAMGEINPGFYFFNVPLTSTDQLKTLSGILSKKFNLAIVIEEPTTISEKIEEPSSVPATPRTTRGRKTVAGDLTTGPATEKKRKVEKSENM